MTLPYIDSSPTKGIEAIYIKRIREMSGARRLEIAAGLCDAAKEIAIAGIRHNHPGISDQELKLKLMKRIYG